MESGKPRVTSKSAERATLKAPKAQVVPKKSFDSTLAKTDLKRPTAKIGTSGKATIQAAIQQAADDDADAAIKAEAKEQLAQSLARGVAQNPKAGKIDMDKAEDPSAEED